MQNPESESGFLFRLPFAAMAIMFALAVAATQSAQAQTFTDLHSFTNHGDGNSPFAGPTMDRAGNIYGVTLYGGAGHGTAFKLSKRAGNWILDTLHTFTGGSDGDSPFGNVTLGPDGNVYGTTIFGGGGCTSGGCGTVFKLSPPPRICTHTQCPWTETVIYRFSASDTGLHNPWGGVTFDSAGNIYGTTSAGGTGDCSGQGCGAVYKLTPSGGTWTASVIYNFTGFEDGEFPMATMTIDPAGNLYGTTYYGNSVFELVRSGSGWTENTLYSFQDGADGGNPQAGVVFDSAGNLYGATTTVDGSPAGGVVYELTHSPGGWTYSVLYTYNHSGGLFGNVAIDSAGNIYGTAVTGGIYQGGSVFKLTNSGGVWSLTDLHDFGGIGWPEGNVLLDASGNLYGTAIGGGQYGWGSVWEIQP